MDIHAIKSHRIAIFKGIRLKPSICLSEWFNGLKTQIRGSQTRSHTVGSQKNTDKYSINETKDVLLWYNNLIETYKA